ncbi:MAG: hypothetical protein GXP54_11475, partial [Deltaproteobacteria bacterium]|nr:hypothetical protein [Deltaproteobacteria bacterium]
MKMALKVLSTAAFLLFAVQAHAQEKANQEKADPKSDATVEKAAATTEQGDEGIPDSVALLTGSSTGGKRKIPFGGFLLLETQLGSGTFVQGESKTPFFAWLLSIRPRYYFTDNIFAELRIDLQQELTTSYATTTTKKRQVMPSDTLLTLKWQNAASYERWLMFSPYIRFGAPSSYESHFRDLYLSLAAGFDLSSILGPIVLTYSFRFNKNFNENTVATVDKDELRPVAAVRSGGAEDLGSSIATGINNTSFSIFNSLMMSIMLSDEWTLTAQFAIANAWTYANLPIDNQSGVGATGGRGQKDLMYGVVDLTYQPFQHIGFSLGIST